MVRISFTRPFLQYFNAHCFNNACCEFSASYTETQKQYAFNVEIIYDIIVA